MTTLAIGDSFDVETHGTALGGAAVARLPDGRVCFIHGTMPGERLSIEITSVKRSYAEGRITQILTASSDRVTPRCAVYGRCGGCQYQHVAYDRQVALKTRQLLDTLQRLGGVRLAAIDEVHAAPSPWAYRNRITLHACDDGYGYQPVAGRTVVAITSCPIACAEVEAGIAQLPTSTGEAAESRVTIRWAPGNGAVTFADEAPAEMPWRSETVGGQPYVVPSGSFAQVNAQVAELLFALVGRWLAPLPAVRVIDAYCGAGFLGLAVTGRPVVGVEIDGPSIVAARANAAARGLAATHSYQAGDVDTLVEALLAEAPARTCLILDPPRAGCGAGMLAALSRQPPAWILYVSCDPATLARDLKTLAPLGYRVERSALLDMFPQTAHFESALLLTR